MSLKFILPNLLLFLFLISTSENNSEASSFFYTRCEEKVEECLAMGKKEENNDPMLRETKEAYRSKDYENAIQYANKTINAHRDEALHMQASLKEYPWESHKAIFSYGSLNTVAVALYIKAKSYKNLGMIQEARKTYNELIDNFYYGQCCNCCAKNIIIIKPAVHAAGDLETIGNK